MEKSIKKILMEINQFCNLNCTYCFYNDFEKSQKYLSINNIKNICEIYQNADDFYLTGGECTLNRDFSEIVEFLSTKGNVTLFSNGLTFSQINDIQLQKIINKTSKIIITYDSINSNYILRKGFEKNVIYAIKKILKINSEKLEIKICLNKLNFSDFEKTLGFLTNLGVKHISINYIKNIASNKTNFELSKQEIKESFLIIQKYKEYFNKENICFIEESYKQDFKNQTKCIAGEKFIYIDCQGEKFYCPSSCKKIDDKKNNKCFGKHCINLWEMFI